MCLILFSYHQHPQYPLIFLSNRDEFYARPSAPASFWDDYPFLLAGKDLQKSGTWMGITRQGRISAVTNFRESSSAEGRPEENKNSSRGTLVLDYLLEETSLDSTPNNYLNRVANNKNQYNGFNLLVGNQEQLSYYSNRGGDLPHNHVQTLDAGVYGLSNHLLNTSWPKVTRGKQFLTDLITSQKKISIEKCLEFLSDKTIFTDEELPDTGVGLERERYLSPIFISTPEYGTRASTIVLINQLGEVTFVEKYYSLESQQGGPPQWKEHQFEFVIEH